MIIIKYCNTVIKIIFIIYKRLMREMKHHENKKGYWRKKKTETALLKGLHCQKLRCSWNSKIEYDFQDVVISLPACQSLNQL